MLCHEQAQFWRQYITIQHTLMFNQDVKDAMDSQDFKDANDMNWNVKLTGILQSVIVIKYAAY